MPERPRSRVLLAVTFLVVLAAISFALWRGQSSDSSIAKDEKISEIARQVSAIEAGEQHASKTVWAEELLARQCARVFEDLWDALNSSDNKLEALAAFDVGEIAGPALGDPASLACGVRLFEQAGLAQAWNGRAWRQFISEIHNAGWRLARVEFRHIQFDASDQGQPERSRFYSSAHLTNAVSAIRAIVEGELTVFWGAGKPGSNPGVFPLRIEADNFSVRTREGEPGLREVLSERVSPPSGSHFIDPLIVYDLDGDGLSEIILAASNLVFRRGSDGEFFREPFCRHPPGLIFTGILGDFDGDGAADFLCAKFEGLILLKGSAAGMFDEPGRLVWAADPRLRYAQALTCGDIDRDGDLDVWLGQYKVPYNRGQMPSPFYDANDGHPSHLLTNDGRGGFHDATVDAGLGKKRWRRAYSGSFADFDNDGNLDLIAVSDFAGVDLFSNDGRGHFEEITSEALSDRHAFGMSQVWSDLNSDGFLDLLMIGMNVPAADRLRHYNRARPGHEKLLAMTGPMSYGNRLFLGDGSGKFRQTKLNDSIARTGWSWGCGAFDLDNDGFLDLAITNGHESRQSVRDYEPEFWLHDIYVGNSKNNLAAFTYFRSKAARTRGQGMSYGGYEKNRLYLNRGGESFVEIAHLMGIGLEEDSRNVVAADLNNDGRMDLLVTTFEVWPEVKQTMRLFTNTLATDNNWIAFRLSEQGQGVSPVGARIVLKLPGRTAVRDIVAGDSYRSQQPNTAHFGLGAADQAESVEIRWANGRSTVLQQPAINQFHSVRLE